ncbi:MAG: glycoside hydrolase family 3 C-terminal domain-containing protein [Actinomycetota bacterium]|nr:glycoside hydrolase family 3 C-terminal domain-containing protein [Actinomycetota bacterium]
MAQDRYRDPSLRVEERCEDLLAQMTLEEKLAQLGCAWIAALMDRDGFSAERARQVAPHGIGEVTRISGATALKPNESAALMNEIQAYMTKQTRLGIPVLVHEEGLGGFLARDATVFPQALGLAASFDPGLVEQVAGVIREQLRAVGARHCLAPVLDVARDPRWGRVEETFGEDPVLCGVLGTAYVRGLQTGDLARGVLATGKHFLGHALPEGGRNHAPVQLGPRELREVYAEPFAAAINQANLASVMNSYSSIDGLAPAGARAILTDLLRGELGFSGMVVADYFAISLLMTHHHVAADKAEAAAKSLAAGMDLELPETSCFGAPLRAAIEAGKVDLVTLDVAVRRVLSAKFALGLFEHPFVEEGRAVEVFETPAQRELAREAAIESLVLLKNDGILPLPSGLTRLALIGPGSDDRRLLQGDYHYPAHQQVIIDAAEDGSLADTWSGGGDLNLLPVTGGEWQPGAYYTEHVTPLAGLRSAAPAGLEITYAKGCDVLGEDTSGIDEAVRVARGAEVAVVVVAGRSGLAPSSTVGEARDATRLELTGVQHELVEAVAATKTPTVVVVLSGRVHDLTRIDALANALIQAFPLGEEGGAALAQVLYGTSAPSGRLPVSLPRAVGQVPAYSGHRSGGSTAMFYGSYADGPTTPLYPFGHGLSYTTFAYDGLEIDASDTTSPVSVRIDVTNDGERDGTEVVQLYVRDVVAQTVRPERQLVGFARVALGAGETRSVTFTVHPSRLGLYGEDLVRVTEPGEFTFSVGASAGDLPASKTIVLNGEVTSYPIATVVPTAVALSPSSPRPAARRP